MATEDHRSDGQIKAEIKRLETELQKRQHRNYGDAALERLRQARTVLVSAGDHSMYVPILDEIDRVIGMTAQVREGHPLTYHCPDCEDEHDL
jgi:hypothetical protein